MVANSASDDYAGVTIVCQPGDVWDFYEQHRKELEEVQGLIASNEETNHEVYITEDYGYPVIMVYRDDVLVYEESIVNEQDCQETALQIYMKYLFPVVVSGQDLKSSAVADGVDDSLGSGEEMTEDEWHAYAKDMADQSEEEVDDDHDGMLEGEVYVREDELLCGLYDFLDIVLDGKTAAYFDSVYEEELSSMLDELLLIIAGHGLPVRRPTFVESEDGVEVYLEYPYEETDDDQECEQIQI